VFVGGYNKGEQLAQIGLSGIGWADVVWVFVAPLLLLVLNILGTVAIVLL
jgi:hypothetical protein